MRPLDLNLASRPFRNNTLLWLGYGFLAAGVVTFTAWNTVTFVETGRTLAAERNTVGSIANREEAMELRERNAQAEIARYDVKYLSMETSRANDVIQRKAMSWTRLFNLLEATQPYEVRMVSVRPTFGAAVRATVAGPASGGEAIPVEVDGTAKDLRAFLDFERALIRDPHFDRVEPQRTTNNKGGELLFSLGFSYYPGGRVGGKGEDQAQTPPESQGNEPAVAEADIETGRPPKVAEPLPASPVTNNGAGSSTGSAPAAPPPGTAVLLANPLASPSAAQPAPNVAAPSTDSERDTAQQEQDPRERFRQKPKGPPPGPIRKRPPGWQPPDPFAKDKKEGDQKSPSAGDRK